MATPSLDNFDVLVDGSSAMRPPSWVNHRVLAAGVAETETIPTISGKKPRFVTMNADANFYAAYRKTGDGAPPTAMLPVADVTNGTGCEINPVSRMVTGLTGISLISPDDCVVTLAYFA